jgi:simple sugar transport system permease protein
MNINMKKVKNFVIDNLVVILFVSLTGLGFILSEGISLVYFLSELTDRVFRNGFLVISLIIPIIAGLGLNFGIVIGAMAGQMALIFVRYHDMGGIGSLLLCFVLAFPLAVLFGFLTGKLYNRVRGQEMIASLIVGFFANGVYNFIFLFAVGYIIPVSPGNPIIMFNDIGVRMSIDLGLFQDGGLKYALDNLIRIPTMVLILGASILILVYLIIRRILESKNVIHEKKSPWAFWINCFICVALIAVSILAIASESIVAGYPSYSESPPIFRFFSDFMFIRSSPLITALVIVALCFFLQFLMKTKLGQDFRSVGQNQHIAEVSGINVDRTRIIATIFSTVLAAWGMIIFMQNMGTLAVYDSHRNIGLFSVAALLVGGASTSRASIKNALVGAALFNSMTIISPELGKAFFGDPSAGEFFRSFMVYGVIGLALGLYVWKSNQAIKEQNKL